MEMSPTGIKQTFGTLPALTPGLNTFPNELILEIIDQLPKGEISTLRALNETNWRLHNLTLDRLYGTFPGLTVEKFLRTITEECPAHADRVKKVVWNRHRRGYICPLEPESRDTIAQRLRDVQPSFSGWEEPVARFIAQRRDESDQAWYFDLFILFFLKVEEIVIHNSWFWDDHVYWFDTLVANASRFGNLHSVTIHGPLRIENIVPLLTLPSLRNLDMTLVVVMREELDRGFMWDKSPHQAVRCRLGHGSSSLEHLTLQESYIDIKSLVPLFEAFRALKSFAYDHVSSDFGIRQVLEMDLASLELCLRHQQASLEQLSIQTKRPSSDFEALKMGAVLPSLQHLRTLELNPFFLTDLYITDWDTFHGVDRFAAAFVQGLPRALERLVFNCQYTMVGGQNALLLKHLPPLLRALPDLLRPALSRLRELAVTNWPPFLGIFPPDFVMLQKAFAGVYVQFVSMSAELMEPGPFDILDDGEEEGWLVVQKNSAFRG